jgi:hypothetical protein
VSKVPVVPLNCINILNKRRFVLRQRITADRVFAVRLLFVLAFAALLIAGSSANSEECTLSEEAILSLDYNMSDFFPNTTARVVSKKLIPGEGVDFQIHFASTNGHDASFGMVSDTEHGSGAAAGQDVSTCSRLSLRFSFVSIDGSTNAPGILVIGTGVGDTPGRPIGLLAPRHISLTKRPQTTVSATGLLGTKTNYVTGFLVALDSEFGDGPHDIVLRVQPADVSPKSPTSP